MRRVVSKTAFLLQDMNNVWLAKSSFVAGEQISIADLLISCELSMLELLDGAKVRPPLSHFSQEVVGGRNVML